MIYPLVMTVTAIESSHWNSEFSHWRWWFSIAILNYQRIVGTQMWPLGLEVVAHKTGGRSRKTRVIWIQRVVYWKHLVLSSPCLLTFPLGLPATCSCMTSSCSIRSEVWTWQMFHLLQLPQWFQDVSSQYNSQMLHVWNSYLHWKQNGRNVGCPFWFCWVSVFHLFWCVCVLVLLFLLFLVVQFLPWSWASLRNSFHHITQAQKSVSPSPSSE